MRSTPRRLLTELEQEKTLFPASLTPYACAKFSLGPEVVPAVLTRRLYLYQDFTTALEQTVVNPVLVSLSNERLGISLPPPIRLDAHRIYVDEAYHALAALDLTQQLAGATGVDYHRTARHRFQDNLARRMADVDSGRSGLLALCAATVSETLISGMLSLIPGDPSVVTVVREVVADHAEDEHFHHAFFTRVHEFVWPQLPAVERTWLAPLFADFIGDFLRPDVAAEAEILVQGGLAPDAAIQLVREAYDDDETERAMRHAARATLGLLARTGVLDDEGVHDHFASAGLLV